MEKLKGTFMITGWDEQAFAEHEDGSKQTRAEITQTYTGDIEGTSRILYAMSYQPDGSAVFVGYETLTGSIGGNSGSLVFQHNGKFEHGIASSMFFVVPGAGKDQLSSFIGAGSFQAKESGQADYELELIADMS